jgi:hypothetical protein
MWFFGGINPIEILDLEHSLLEVGVIMTSLSHYFVKAPRNECITVLSYHTSCYLVDKLPPKQTMTSLTPVNAVHGLRMQADRKMFHISLGSRRETHRRLLAM